MPFRIKRIYEPVEAGDGYRILVDRLWPRGLTKEKAKLDEWAKEISPSNELRKWYGHDPAKWDEFKTRYAEELAPNGETLLSLKRRAEKSPVTLLFSSKELDLNNARALKEYLETLG